MKKIFFFSFLILNIIHCPITNKIFLKTSRVTGTEAKEIINNRVSIFFVNDISFDKKQRLISR